MQRANGAACHTQSTPLETLSEQLLPKSLQVGFTSLRQKLLTPPGIFFLHNVGSLLELDRWGKKAENPPALVSCTAFSCQCGRQDVNAGQGSRENKGRSRIWEPHNTNINQALWLRFTQRQDSWEGRARFAPLPAVEKLPGLWSWIWKSLPLSSSYWELIMQSHIRESMPCMGQIFLNAVLQNIIT